MTESTEPIEPAVDPAAETEPVAVASAVRVSRGLLIGLIAGAGALLLALALVVALVIIPQSARVTTDAHPKPSAVSPTGSTSPTPRPTPSRTSTPTPTPTTTQVPVAQAPAPVPAPADPAPPAPGTPALPAPPAPVIPITVTSMDAYAPGGNCTSNSGVYLAWTTSGPVEAMNLNIRSGSGSPLFDQNWSGYPANDTQQFFIDCTRPLWYFTLTITSGAQSKTARLTFANGQNKGWSSN